MARTTTPETKSLGYSIYYTLVNLGGAIGPLLAMQVRENLGIAYVLVMSSLVSLGLMGTAIFFREPPRPADAPLPKSMAKVLGDMFMVFKDLKFMSFLVIFSGFWIMFWQIFYALPFYVRDVLHFERFEIIETVDAWTIILITIPITALAKQLKPLAAMTLGIRDRFGILVPDGSRSRRSRRRSWRLRVARSAKDSRRRATTSTSPTSRPKSSGTLHGLRLSARHRRLCRRCHRRAAGATLFGVRQDSIFTPGPRVAHAGRMWFWVGGIGIVSTLAMLAYDRLVVEETPLRRGVLRGLRGLRWLQWLRRPR